MESEKKSPPPAVERYEGIPEPICSVCSKVISGSYRMRNGNAYHLACLAAALEAPPPVFVPVLTSDEAAAESPKPATVPPPSQVLVEPLEAMEAMPARRLRIYVAGASKEPKRVQAAMDAMRLLDYDITLDWLEAIQKEGAANEGLDDEKRRRYAKDDLGAVLIADVVWLLASDLATTGSWVELGAALAWQRRIVVSGPARERCIFASLAEYETDSDLAALAYIVKNHPALPRP